MVAISVYACVCVFEGSVRPPAGLIRLTLRVRVISKCRLRLRQTQLPKGKEWDEHPVVSPRSPELK